MRKVMEKLNKFTRAARRCCAAATAISIAICLFTPNVSAAEITESATVAQNEAFTLPETVSGETVNWSSTASVDTSKIGVQIFNGITAEGNSVRYTVKVGKYVDRLLLSETMEDYEENAVPSPREDGSGLALNANVSKIVYEDDSKTNKVWQKSGWNTNDFENVRLSELHTGDITVTGTIKLDLSSIPTGLSSSIYPISIIGSNITSIGTIENSLGGFGIRVYQNTENKLLIKARPSYGISSYTGSEVTLFGTNSAYIDPVGIKTFQFEICYFKGKTCRITVNGITIAENQPINPDFGSSTLDFRTLFIANRSKQNATYTIDDIKIFSKEIATVSQLPEMLTDTVYKNSSSEKVKTVTLPLSNSETFETTARYTVDTTLLGTQTVNATLDGFTETIPVSVTVKAAENERYLNISKGKNATALYNTDTAARATDGIVRENSANYAWTGSDSPSENQWWQVDLGEMKQITAIKLATSIDAAAEYMKNFKILVSDDADFTLPTEIAAQGDTPFGISGESFIKTLDIPVAGRFVRVQKTATEAFRIDEFSVYETDYTLKNVAPGEPVTTFVLTSDVHSSTSGDRGETRFRTVMDKAYTLYPDLSGVIVNGDLINNGTEEELKLITSAMKETIKDGTQLIFNRGNHEINNKSLSYEQKLSMWLEATNQPLLQNIVVGNVRVITIGIEDGNYTQASAEWLDTQLAVSAASTPDIPVFVAIHYPVSSTIFGAQVSYNNSITVFNDVLNQYPMATVVSSHIHKPLHSPENIWQNDVFTAVQTSTLNGMVPCSLYHTASADYSLANCLFAEIDAEGVVTIKRYDVANDTFIGDPFIYKPGDTSTYQYTDNRELRSASPAFSADASIAENAKTFNSVTVSFPSATDDEGVEVYRVSAENSSGVMVAESYLSSKYYSVDSTDNKIMLTNLEPNTEYTISVTAYDFYHKKSAPVVKKISTLAISQSNDGNVALNKPVTASFNADLAQNITDGIIDGTGNNWWTASSGADTPYAIIDLGREYDLGYVVLVSRKNSPSAVGQTANITLQLSNDPAFAEGNYIEIGTTPQSGLALNEDFVVKLDDTANYRYIRAIRKVKNYICVPEIEAFAKTNANGPRITGITVENGTLKDIKLVCDTTVTYTASIIVGVYNESTKELVSAKTISENYKPVRTGQEQTVSVSDNIAVSEGQLVKVFVWNNLTALSPQMKNFSAAQ